LQAQRSSRNAPLSLPLAPLSSPPHAPLLFLPAHILSASSIRRPPRLARGLTPLFNLSRGRSLSAVARVANRSAPAPRIAVHCLWAPCTPSAAACTRDPPDPPAVIRDTPSAVMFDPGPPARPNQMRLAWPRPAWLWPLRREAHLYMPPPCAPCYLHAPLLPGACRLLAPGPSAPLRPHLPFYHLPTRTRGCGRLLTCVQTGDQPSTCSRSHLLHTPAAPHPLGHGRGAGGAKGGQGQSTGGRGSKQAGATG
jgi:hypothetical protein